jgi:hypothetical protein
MEVAVLPWGAASNTRQFDRSFEEVIDCFNQLPRMFVELDGSFVWVAAGDGSRGQLDGVVTDDGIRVLNVELKGVCTEPMLDDLLRALGWPKQAMAFQLVQFGVYVEEAEFRRLIFQPMPRG